MTSRLDVVCSTRDGRGLPLDEELAIVRRIGTDLLPTLHTFND
jgi:hypothetical protein